MNTYKRNPTPEENRVDNISASRYIPHMKSHGNRLLTTEVEAKFVGTKGVLIQADCLDLLANLKNDSVDLVFLDPPFNIKKKYNIPNFDDNFDNEFYKGLCRTWILECIR